MIRMCDNNGITNSESFQLDETLERMDDKTREGNCCVCKNGRKCLKKKWKKNIFLNVIPFPPYDWWCDEAEVFEKSVEVGEQYEQQRNHVRGNRREH